VHLVDASPLVFRAFFSLPASIRTPDGRPANAVRGFATTLLRLLADEDVSHLGVAFDESLTTSFRNEIHAGYKADRELPPPELEAQLRDCRAFVEALGAPAFVHERYEADDLIATIWSRLRAEGHRVVVVSPDKDLCQLVDEGTVLLDLAAGRRHGPAEVRERLGVRPDQVLDLLALAGDPVDSIPGVPGIGRKTAAALLAGLGDLDAIYADLERVEGLPLRGAASVRRKLEAGRDRALLSRRLAALAHDAPAHASLDDLRLLGAEPSVLEPLLDDLGLQGLRDRVPLREP
jgi:5'-3' exonuclease